MDKAQTRYLRAADGTQNRFFIKTVMLASGFYKTDRSRGQLILDARCSANRPYSNSRLMSSMRAQAILYPIS